MNDAMPPLPGLTRARDGDIGEETRNAGVEEGDVFATCAVPEGAPSAPTMMRQRSAGRLALRAEVAASDGYAFYGRAEAALIAVAGSM